MSQDASTARAETLVELGRHTEAETMSRTLLASAPEDVRVLLVLVGSLEGQDRSAEAMEVAREATRIAPESDDTWRALAHVACDLDDSTIAVQAAQRVVELAPHSWTSHYVRGRALLAGHRPRTRDALACANQAVRLAPWSADAHNLAGMCCSDLGLTTEAQRAYEEALRIDPHHSLAMNNIGALAVNTGRLTVGSRHLRSALSTDPQLDISRRNLERTLVRLVFRRCAPVLLLGVLFQGLLLDAPASPWFRAGLAVFAVLLVGLGVRRTVREGPRASLRWFVGLGVRTGPMGFAALLLIPGLTLAVLALGLGQYDIPDPQPTEPGGEAVGSMATTLAHLVFGAMLWGGFWLGWRDRRKR